RLGLQKRRQRQDSHHWPRGRWRSLLCTVGSLMRSLLPVALLAIGISGCRCASASVADTTDSQAPIQVPAERTDFQPDVTVTAFYGRICAVRYEDESRVWCWGPWFQPHGPCDSRVAPRAVSGTEGTVQV